MTSAPDGSLLIADLGAPPAGAGGGVVEFRKGQASLVADVPVATDIAALGNGQLYVTTTGGPPSAAVWRIRGSQAPIRLADLWAFEAANNPDQGAAARPGMEIDSNPFDVEALPGDQAVVADAAGNDLIVVDRNGADWIATLPVEVLPTASAQALIGCPSPPPQFGFLAFVCGVSEMPAQAVATSVDLGPDGMLYAGELKGVPGTPGESRIWRIDPNARHVRCGTSDPGCELVFDGGFTSIVDLNFGPDGTLYVTELDEASFLAVEGGSPSGGSVDACNVVTRTCVVVATGLPNMLMPMATAVGKDGTLYALTEVLTGAPKVVVLP